MAKGTPKAAWALAVCLMAGTMARAGETVTSASVTIRLDDLAGTPETDLTAAKAEMDRIFLAAGVDVKWVGATEMPRPGQLTLILLKHNAQPADARGDIAGEAVRETARAYVYCDQIDNMTRHLPADANVILGRVMAHEIGHLLLPRNSHSRVGVMRPHVDFSQVTVTTFSSDEARSLRGALSAPARP
jgi:hypothetical protein